MKLMKTLAVVLLAVVLCVGSAEAARTNVAALATATVQVPAGQTINVFSISGPTRVFKQSGGVTTGFPLKYEEETSSPVVNNEVVFGPYTNATKVQIVAGTQGAMYNIGALAVANPILVNTPRFATTLFAPATYNTTSSFVSNDLMNGLITATHAVGVTLPLTLPTGALLDAASGLQVNQAFSWTLINLSAAASDSITITASSGHTIVGDPIVISTAVTTGGAITSHGNSTSRWLTRKTAANTFITYRW